MDSLWTQTLSQQARQALTPLAKDFIIDDPVLGLLAVIPVVGGTMQHPLTGQVIPGLTVYAASSDLVKILEPKFLRCLPLVPLPGLLHPSQFCASVARTLGDILRRLSILRAHLLAMNLTVELERDFLRLRGRCQLASAELEWTAGATQQFEIQAINGQGLHGSILRAERILNLTGQPKADLDHVSLLVSVLAARMNDAIAADKSISLPEQTGSTKEAEAIAANEPSTQQGEVVASQQRTSEESLGLVPIALLVDKLGPQVEISAHRGRLRLVAQLKVLQGIYTFYLQQEKHTRFIGKMVTPAGVRHQVEVDLAAISDIKEVFDRIIMGK